MEVCRQVRRLSMDPQPVMIALTGWGREDDMRSSREAGFDHHLVKPVATEKLEALLCRVGDGRDGAGRAATARLLATRTNGPLA